MPAELRLAEAVEDLDLEEPPVVNSRVAPLGDGELDMELVISEHLLRHDVGAATIVAAEQDGTGRATAADRHETSGVRRIEPNLIADDPDLLGTGIAECPSGQVLAVKERLPAVFGRELSAMAWCPVAIPSPRRTSPSTRPSRARSPQSVPIESSVSIELALHDMAGTTTATTDVGMSTVSIHSRLPSPL